MLNCIEYLDVLLPNMDLAEKERRSQNDFRKMHEFATTTGRFSAASFITVLEKYKLHLIGSKSDNGTWLGGVEPVDENGVLHQYRLLLLDGASMHKTAACRTKIKEL